MKNLIAALVAGVIMFLWQFLSWAAINFHGSAQKFHPQDAEIMAFLESKFSEEGGYIIPGMPEGASQEEYEKHMKDREGKPWFHIRYHKSLNTNMGMNMIRGLSADIFMMYLFVLLLARISANSLGSTLTACLSFGMIAFLYAFYTNHIWYPAIDIWAHLGDAIASWALVGLWLGWYLNRK